MTILAWGDPPPKPKRSGYRGEQVAELESRPGEWGMIEEHMTTRNASALCSYLRKKYGLEAESRDLAGECSVWARANA